MALKPKLKQEIADTYDEEIDQESAEEMEILKNAVERPRKPTSQKPEIDYTDEDEQEEEPVEDYERYEEKKSKEIQAKKGRPKERQEQQESQVREERPITQQELLDAIRGHIYRASELLQHFG